MQYLNDFQANHRKYYLQDCRIHLWMFIKLILHWVPLHKERKLFQVCCSDRSLHLFLLPSLPYEWNKGWRDGDWVLQEEPSLTRRLFTEDQGIHDKISREGILSFTWEDKLKEPSRYHIIYCIIHLPWKLKDVWTISKEVQDLQLNLRTDWNLLLLWWRKQEIEFQGVSW